MSVSFFKHGNFDISFLIAGTCIVALLSVNTDWIFRSRKLAFRALAVFTLPYTFIYVLLRVEAYALLVGATASFAAVAAAMYITRDTDWYGNATSPSSSSISVPPARVAHES